MSQHRASTARIVFSPAGKRQPDFDTAMQTADLTKVLPDTAKTFYKKEQTREEQLDCSTEEIYTKILLGEIGDISIAFDVTRRLVSALLAYLYGVAAAPTGTNPYTHQLDELPVGSYQPSPFSLIFGFAGVADPLLLRGCTMNSLGLSGRARQKLTGQSNIKFAEATVAAGFTFPSCLNEPALRFGDSRVLKGATDFMDAKTLRSWDYNFSNNLITGAHAFTDEGTAPTRLERADRRTRSLKYSVLGDNKDALYTAAEAGSEDSFTLQLGAGNDKVTVGAPQAIHELDGGGLQKDGEANETLITVVATPEIVAGNSHSPTNVVVVNDQSSAYLVASE
jgi:hypothetical protein